MKSIVCVIISLAFAIIPTSLWAGVNGLQLIGNSPINKSMGGAGVAVPLDSFNLLLNPAGIAKLSLRNDFFTDVLKPESSYEATTDYTPVFTSLAALAADPNTPTEVLTEIQAISDATAGVSPISSFDETSQVDSILIPGFGTVFHKGKRVSLGLAMAGVAGLAADYKRSIYDNVLSEHYSVLRMVAGMSYQVSKRLSLGAGLDLNHASLSFEMGSFASHNTQMSLGTGWQLGLSYDLSSQLSVSAAYISQQDFDPFKFNTAPPQRNLAGIISGPSTENVKDELDLDLPANILLGIGYFPTKNWSIALDVKQIEWSAVLGKDAPDGKGNLKDQFNANWSDQTVYALGLQYLDPQGWSLRAGINHGQSPQDEDRAFENIAFNLPVETHYTVGGGYRFSKHGEVHVVYMQSAEASTSGANADQLITDYESTLSVQSFGLQLAQSF